MGRTRTRTKSSGPPATSSESERRAGWRRAGVAPKGSNRTFAAGPSLPQVSRSSRALGYPSFLSPLSCPVVPSQPGDTLTQLGKGDARRVRGLRIQTGAGHARQGVGFETEDVSLGAHPKVDPRVATELHGAVRHHRILLQLSGEHGVDPGRKGLVRHPRRVFGLIVEQLVLRNDLADRK